MELQMDIYKILKKAPKDWTAKDRATMHKFTEPLNSKTYNEMSADERRLVATLFRLYFSHSDKRGMAIAYCVIIGGIPMSRISRLRLIDDPSWTYIATIENGLELSIRRIITLDGEPWKSSDGLLFDSLMDYIINSRGFDIGPLFYNSRHHKGQKGKMPTISHQSVGRIFTPATTDLGIGKNRKLQYFHRLANDIED